MFEKTNINEKEAGEGQLYLKKTLVRFGQWLVTTLLVEQSLPTLEALGSNPVIGKI